MSDGLHGTQPQKAPAGHIGQISAFVEISASENDNPSVGEALNSEEQAEWRKTFNQEMQSHQSYGTWDLVELPPGKKALASRTLPERGKDADELVAR